MTLGIPPGLLLGNKISFAYDRSQEDARFVSDYFPLDHEISAFEAAIAAGQLPEIGNGFSYLMHTMPAGKKNNIIPSDEYTDLFSQGLFPMAAKDHVNHIHDVGHGAIAQRLFRNTLLAATVRGAATNAKGNIELQKAFTGAMDRFGDRFQDMRTYLKFLMPSTRCRVLGFTHKAEHELETLVNLSQGAGNQQTAEGVATLSKLMFTLDVLGYRDYVDRTIQAKQTPSFLGASALGGPYIHRL